MMEYIAGQCIGDYGLKFTRFRGENEQGQMVVDAVCKCGKNTSGRIEDILDGRRKVCSYCYRIYNRTKWYPEGTPIGKHGLKFVKDIGKIKGVRKIEFKCPCGKNGIANLTKIKSNVIKSCGCMKNKINKINKKKEDQLLLKAKVNNFLTRSL